MSNLQNNASYNTAIFSDDQEQYYRIQFWIFLVLIIPAITCSIFGLYHLLFDRNLRKSLHNHVLIVLLTINLFYHLTDMFWFIHYFRTFRTFSVSPTFRLVWGYIDWTFFVMQYALYAWITIERHILIFHHQLLSTIKRRLLIHYLPPVLISIYCIVYYAVVIFISTCKNNFDNISTPSFVPCSYENNVLYTYDSIFNEIMPTFIIVLASSALLLRTLWQKYRMKQRFQWQRHRVMVIQVLLLSSIFLLFPFPYFCVLVFQLYGIASDTGAALLSATMFFTYYALFLFPLVVLGSLPQIRQRLKKIFEFKRRRNVIAPVMLTNANGTDKKTATS